MTINLFTMTNNLYATRRFPVGATMWSKSVWNWIIRQELKYGANLRREIVK